MAFYLSPLVDVNEIDLSTTIPAVATSIGVIVLRDTFKGPENKQILVTDESDLIRAFGEPMDRVAPQASSYEDLMAATGFLKYGNKLYCTRVMPDDARFATNKATQNLTTDTGVGLTVDTTTVNGVITVMSTNVGGTGWRVGELFDLPGGAIGEVLTETVPSSGIVDTITVVSGGTGYSDDVSVVAATLSSSAELTTGGNGLTLSYGDVVDSVTALVDDGVTTLDSVVDGTYTVTGNGSVSGIGLTLDVTFVGDVITGTIITDAGAGFETSETVTVPFGDFLLSGAVSGGVVFTVDTIYAGASGVIEAGELTMTSGGTRYAADQTYDVTGPSGEGAVITVDTVDLAGTVLTYTITTAGSEYVAGDLELRIQVGQADIGSGTLDDLPSGDPDDFGDDVSVAAGDLVWTIGMARGDWGDDIRIAFLDKPTQIDLMTGVTDPVASRPSEAFSSIDSQLDKANDFLVLVQAIDQRKNTWVTKETWNVSCDPNAIDDTGAARFVEKVVNQTSQYIRQAVSVDMIGDETDVDVQTYLATLSNDMWFDLGDGYDGSAGADDGNIRTAYELYDNPEEVDVNIFIDSGKSDGVKSLLVDICGGQRKDAIAVADCPKSLVLNNKGNEAEALRNWRNSDFNMGGHEASYVAVYGNWIEVYDKFNQKYRWIPASGHVAGVYAKTDDVRDPWWAPAGLNRAVLNGVRRLAWNPKLGYRDILYSNGINPIVTFPGEGKVIWGQKTMLPKESAFNRVNVRRLFLVLEKAISTASVYFLFEPNDPQTRTGLVNMIQPFLRDVQARRGIYDFKVVCDDSNNTPTRIDRNELWCNIFIKPTRTAEFIVLNFVATATGASFEEAAAAV